MVSVSIKFSNFPGGGGGCGGIIYTPPLTDRLLTHFWYLGLNISCSSAPQAGTCSYTYIMLATYSSSVLVLAERRVCKTPVESIIPWKNEERIEVYNLQNNRGASSKTQ